MATKTGPAGPLLAPDQFLRDSTIIMSAIGWQWLWVQAEGLDCDEMMHGYVSLKVTFFITVYTWRPYNSPNILHMIMMYE